jgi:hypothetical protein
LLNQSSDQVWDLWEWEKYIRLGLGDSMQELSNPDKDIKRFSKTFRRLQLACPSLPAVDGAFSHLSGPAQVDFLRQSAAYTSDFLERLGHE